MTQDSTQQKIKSPVDIARTELEMMTRQFQNALPVHIPVERFKRVVMTAIQNNPGLLDCDRRSLWNAAVKAATDGLLPDNREGAMVPYKGKVQWLPMIAGVLKKVRNSGELSTIVARVVYGGDRFRNWIDDGGEHILYEPADDPDLNTITRVFAMAKLKDGSIEVEAMTVAQVEKIRAVSMAKDSGPWKQWWDEMAKKTVLRRLAKRLPMSTDLDDLLRRDDDLYEFKQEAKSENVTALPRQKPKNALDQFAAQLEHKPEVAMDAVQAEPEKSEIVDEETGEVTQEPADVEVGPPEAMEAGRVARREGKPRRVPQEFQITETLSESWIGGWNAEDEEIAEAKKAKK